MDILHNNLIKKALESKKINLLENTRVNDAQKMIDLLQAKDNSRFAICKKINSKQWQQWIVNKCDLDYNKLSNIISIEDTYISFNSFKGGFRRRTQDLFSLNAFIVDLDYYNCQELNGETPEYVISFLRNKGLFKDLEPSFFIYSGNGMYIIYLIKDSNPKACLKIWKKIMQKLFERFRKYEADPKSLDAAHVFRLAGSINGKTGNTSRFIYNNNKQFKFEQDKEPVRRYTLPQMADILLPPLSPLPFTKKEQSQVKKEKLIKSKNISNLNTIKRLHTLHNLNYTRMMDLEKLVEIRDGYCVKKGEINKSIDGNREFMCFLYRYWANLYYKDTEKALNGMLALNKKFVEPLETDGLVEDTKSAEDACKLWEETYNKYIKLDKLNRPGIIKFFRDAKCYIYSNKKLVLELGISREEMPYLKTIIIISKEEKNAKNKEYRNEWKRESRRTNGLTKREQEKVEKIEQIKILANEGLKQKEIAIRLGVTPQAISKLLKEIKDCDKDTIKLLA